MSDTSTPTVPDATSREGVPTRMRAALPYVAVRDVLAALRIANLAARAGVTAKTVAQAMTKSDLDALLQHCPHMRPADAVRAALDLAVNAGDVTILARPLGHPMFVHPEAIRRLGGSHASSPSAPRRQRTRVLVLEAARAMGRAVRFCDIIASGDEHGSTAGLDRAAIGRDIQSLCRSGEIVRVREVLGGGVDGQYFYLPAEHAPGTTSELPVPVGPSSWLEHVLAAFQRCWRSECAHAEHEQRRPRPISTGLLRARLLEETELPQARDAQLVSNALVQLAKASPPRVRTASVRTGSHFALWAPADVLDSFLDVGAAYASDAARVVEAAQRAIRRLHVPAVSRRDVEAEITRDPALRPNGASSVAALLSDASKSLIDAGGGTRRRRRAHVLCNVGCVEGEAHYGAPSTEAGTTGGGERKASERDIWRARRYVDLLRLQRRWLQRGAMTQVQCAPESLSAAASVGRLRAIGQGVAQLQATVLQLRLDLIGDLPGLDRQIGEVQSEADAVSHECNRHLARVVIEARRLRSWNPELERTEARGVLETSGVTTTTGSFPAASADAALTTAEVCAMVRARGYVRAMRVTNPTELIALLSHRILRFANDEFAGWRRAASEYHFERAGALLFAALEWGGGMAVLFAQLARQELGLLRDTRFIRAGLAHPRFDARIASAAALAFLPGDAETDDLLAQTARRDPDAGVRRAALWSYGAGARPEVTSLLATVLEREQHRDVLALARAAVEEPTDVWWTV